MTTLFTIRPVQKRDFDQWLALWDAYNEFYGRSGKTALPREITETTWGRFLEDREPVYAFVAEMNGRILGLTHFLYHRSTTLQNHTCYLQDLYTVPEFRGQGIASALIHAVYKEAKENGSKKVYWQTHETNHTAMKLYDKLAERSGFLVYSKAL